MTSNSLLMYAAAIVIGYAFVANRLLVVGAHFRSRAIDFGAQLLRDQNVPEDVKSGVELWLCNIPKSSFAWMFNLIIMPIVFLVCINRWLGKRPRRNDMPSPGANYWKTWDDFTTMAIIATLCNSPVALVLGATQLLFVVSFLRGNYAVWILGNGIVRWMSRTVEEHRHAY